MCMVSVRANFEKVDIVALLYSKTGFGERFDHTVGQYFPSVLYWTYDVIQQAGFVVTLFNMTVFHATNIHRISLPPKQSFGAIFLVYYSNQLCGQNNSSSLLFSIRRGIHELSRRPLAHAKEPP